MKLVGSLSDFEMKVHVIGSPFPPGHIDCIWNNLDFGANAQSYCGLMSIALITMIQSKENWFQ